MSAEPTTYTQTVAELRGDMREGFAKIEGQLTTLTQAIGNLADTSSEAIRDVRSDVTDHERRIRFLERAVWVAAGLGAASGFATGALMA